MYVADVGTLYKLDDCINGVVVVTFGSNLESLDEGIDGVIGATFGGGPDSLDVGVSGPNRVGAHKRTGNLSGPYKLDKGIDGVVCVTFGGDPESLDKGIDGVAGATFGGGPDSLDVGVNGSAEGLERGLHYGDGVGARLGFAVLHKRSGWPCAGGAVFCSKFLAEFGLTGGSLVAGEFGFTGGVLGGCAGDVVGAFGGVWGEGSIDSEEGNLGAGTGAGGGFGMLRGGGGVAFGAGFASSMIGIPGALGFDVGFKNVAACQFAWDVGIEGGERLGVDVMRRRGGW